MITRGLDCDHYVFSHYEYDGEFAYEDVAVVAAQAYIAALGEPKWGIGECWSRTSGCRQIHGL